MTTAFTGSIPQNYDRYLGPVLFEPYAADLAARLPGTTRRALELACGTGIVTRHLRETLPSSATLVATDLHRPMLEHAQESVPLDGIEWRQAAAQDLPFADGSFDAVVCQFGFMFLPDKVQGLREARRVLEPGGVLLANMWQSLDANPAAGALHAKLAELFPDDPPRFLETPYGYDADAIRADLAAAGWDDVLLEPVHIRGEVTSVSDLMSGFVTGSPLANDLAERGIDPNDVHAEVTEALVAFVGGETFAPEHAAVVVTGTRQ